MGNRLKQPVALTVAGSDSGGGAGIQADLKTFAALGVHGTTVLTALTAQNPHGVTGIEAITPKMVSLQLKAIFDGFQPAAMKTGMLFSARAIEGLAAFLKGLKKRPPLIVDPVMVATSGAQLLKTDAVKALKKKLIPIATLVTPNKDEAEILLGHKIASVEDLRDAAREVFEQYGCPALVKGGHLRDISEAVDFFCDGQTELLLSAPFLRKLSTHGSGCTYSAAIAGYMALGCHLSQAVELGKQHITQSIAQSVQAGKHTLLNSFWTDESW